MKGKSESEVAQSRPTLCDFVDCSPPGSSVQGIFQVRVLESGALAIVNSAAMNIGIHVSFSVWLPQDICLGVGLLGHMVVLFLVF